MNDPPSSKSDENYEIDIEEVRVSVILAIKSLEIRQPQTKTKSKITNDPPSINSYDDDDTEEEVRVSVIETKRKSKIFRKAIANFSKGNYEKALHYFKAHVRRCQRKEPPDALDLSLAHEKMGDSFVMLEKDQKALENYHNSINILREHRKALKQESSDICGESNIPFDAEEKVVKRMSQVLVNCGNIYLKISQGMQDRDQLIETCDKAVECYKGAIPWVQDKHGYNSDYSMTLAQRYCKTQDILAKQYLEQDMINKAISVLTDSQSIVKPYLQFSALTQDSKSSKLQELEIHFLKLTIDIGELYLEQNRLDDIIKLSKNTLNTIGLNEDNIDDTHLQRINPKSKELICNMLHNMGTIFKTMGSHEDAVFYFKKGILGKGYNDSNGLFYFWKLV